MESTGLSCLLRKTLLHYGFHIDCGERVTRSRKDRDGKGREWEGEQEEWEKQLTAEPNPGRDNLSKSSPVSSWNPGGQSSRQQPITAAAFSSQYLIPAGALQVTTPHRPLLALVWLNASLSGCKFTVEDAADLPLAPHTHTHTLSHATNQVLPTVSPWVAWIDGRFY